MTQVSRIPCRFPCIAMCRVEENIFYKINRCQTTADKFENLRVEISDLLCEDPEILKKCKIVKESSIAVLIPNEIAEGEDSIFERLTQAVKKVFGDFKLDKKSRVFANNLLKPINAENKFLVMEGKRFLKVIDSYEETVNSPEKTDSTPTPTLRKTYLDFFQSDDPTEFPFYFTINVDDIYKKDLTELCKTLEGEKLSFSLLKNDQNEHFIMINITNSNGNGFSIFTTFQKIQSAVVKADFRLICMIGDFTSKIQSLVKYKKNHPEISDYDSLLNEMNKTDNDAKEAPKTCDQATSPIVFSPKKGPSKFTPNPKVEMIDFSPVKKKRAPKASEDIQEPIDAPKAIAVEEKSKVNQPFSNPTKTSDTDKQSFISRFCSWIAFPFVWCWNGIKNLFKKIFKSG